MIQLQRAPSGGVCRFGHLFKGGEFMPFYIPRPLMPQIDEQDIPSLLEFLSTEGIHHEHKVVPPQSLRAHQRINFDMAVKMEDAVLAKPCLVSADSFILDGNHRWMGHVVRGIDVACFVIGLEFDKAIEALFKFPKTYAYGDGNFHPIKN